MSQSLIMFIRKRDPRYVKETVDEAKLQASLLAASQSQAARAKAAFQENISSFQTQEWMQAEEALEDTEDDEESEIEEEFECVACRKVYKNEKLMIPNLINVLTLGVDSFRPISKARSISKPSRRYGVKCARKMQFWTIQTMP
jgi:hypothetical protein